MTQMLTTDVLIIGAGPVGLSLALDLAWRGVPSVVVDQGTGTIEHPRTGLVAVRTMEFCRRWGIAHDVRACGFPGDFPLNIVFCTTLAGYMLDRADYPGMDAMPTPPEAPEKKQRCPQSWFDPILRRGVERLGRTDLRYRTRLERFEQDAEGVTAHVTHPDGSAGSIRARWMVGCDGGASFVRERLGIPFTGKPALSYSVNVIFQMPGFLDAHDKGLAERYLFADQGGVWGNITVIDGAGLWRLTVLGSEAKMDLDRFDAPAAVRRALGSDAPFEIVSVVPWRRSQLLAERWRDGRVLLAGDAVHTMSPTGGMGANTGVQDAVDLAWKLDAVLQGWGGDTLLDSYEIERKPIAVRNAGFSTHNYRSWTALKDCGAILDETPEGEAVRRIVGTHLRESTRVEWESLGLQIGHRYDASPICIPDGSHPVPDDFSIVVPTARPGARAPHAWLADGRSMLDLFGRGFVLLRFAAADLAAAGTAAGSAAVETAALRRAVPLSVIDIDEPAIARLYGAPLVLVRPDGHVAWRGVAVADADALLATVTGHA